MKQVITIKEKGYKGLSEEQIDELVEPIEYDSDRWEEYRGLDETIDIILDAFFISKNKLIDGMTELEREQTWGAIGTAIRNQENVHVLVALGKYVIDYVASNKPNIDDFNMAVNMTYHRRLFAAAALKTDGEYAHQSNPDIFFFLIGKFKFMFQNKIESVKRYKPLFEKYIGMDEYDQIIERMEKIVDLLKMPIESKRRN